jgi:hypothetical protein
MAEYTESMRRALERSRADGRERMRRLNDNIRMQKRSLADKIYGSSAPDGTVQRFRSIAEGFAKSGRRR